MTLHTGTTIPFGRHNGKLIGSVIICHPDYIHWIDCQPSDPDYQWLYEAIDECIELFDTKPFTIPCAGRKDGKLCTKPVAQASAYQYSADLAFWCNDCDPSQKSAPSYKLTILETYRRALLHVSMNMTTRESYRRIIKQLTGAKGLIGKRTDDKILNFLYGDYLESITNA